MLILSYHAYPPVENSTSRWSAGQYIAYTIALSFRSPVSIFAIESLIALVLLLVLTSFDRLFWVLEIFEAGGGEVDHIEILSGMINTRDVFCAFVPIKLNFLLFVFVNQSLFTLSSVERSALLLYLPAVLATHAGAVVIRLLDARLRLSYIRSHRFLSTPSLASTALLLFLAGLCTFLFRITWPAAELPLWHRFWRILLALQLIKLAITSIIAVVSSAALVLLPRWILQIQAFLECILIVNWVIFVIIEIKLYIQLISAGESNVFMIIVLFGTSAASVAGLCGLIYKLISLPKVLRSQLIDMEGDASFLARVQANGSRSPTARQEEVCSICQELFSEAALTDIARTPCRHYFHARCITAWFLSQTGRSCPICRAQIDTLFPLDRLTRAFMQNHIDQPNIQQDLQQQNNTTQP